MLLTCTQYSRKNKHMLQISANVAQQEITLSADKIKQKRKKKRTLNIVCYSRTVALSHRGQAEQGPGQFPVVSCTEDQTRGVASLGVEGQCDILAGVIWVDKEFTPHERVAGLHNRRLNRTNVIPSPFDAFQRNFGL